MKRLQASTHRPASGNGGHPSKSTAFAVLLSLYGPSTWQGDALVATAAACLQAYGRNVGAIGSSGGDSDDETQHDATVHDPAIVSFPGVAANGANQPHAQQQQLVQPVVHMLEGPDCAMRDLQVDAITTAVGATPTQTAFTRRQAARRGPDHFQTPEVVELPQVCVVTVQTERMQDHWRIVGCLQRESGCDVVACKHTAQVEAFQARVLSPYEIGHPQLKASVAAYCRFSAI